MFKTTRGLGIFALFALCWISGCGDDSSADSDRKLPDDAVIIGVTGDFDSLNELNAADADALQIINHMLFMSLTRLDANYEVEPWLAESWQFAPGDTILTYKLRRDVFWSDGVRTTAQDVRFTWQIASNERFAYPAASRFDLVSKVEAPDSFTVRVTLRRAYADALLDMQMPVLPKHVLAGIPPEAMAEAAFNRKPVTNGPFVLKEWLPNQHLIFSARKNFAPGRAKIDRVVFQIVPDATTLLSKLIAGEIDLIPTLSNQSEKTVRKHPRLKTLRSPSRGALFTGWNLARPYLTKTVRQALTHATDRESMVQALLNGSGLLANSPFSPFEWAYNPDIPHLNYDLSRAKRLLEKEGWRDEDDDGIREKDGRSLTLTIKTNADSQLRVDAAAMLQAQLKAAGVEIKVETLEWNALLDELFDGKDFDGVILSWDADFGVDPTPIWHSSAIENGFNFIGYSNPAVDSLIAIGRNATDRETAQPAWDEFQRIILDDCPYTFLFIPDNITAFNRRVQGLKMDARGFLATISDWRLPTNKEK